MALDVCEIFYSLQGESSFSGVPCSFIRLSGCNLRCKYCDTTYSHQAGKPMDISQIVRELSGYPTRLVEITGGEPLCQSESIGLMKELLRKTYTVLVETNGSLPIKALPREVIKIIDIKCPGSGEEGSFLMDNLEYMTSRDELKFVLSNYADYVFARDFVREYGLLEGTIHFSPVNPVLPAENLAKWLLKDGLQVKLSLQLHRILNLR